MDAKKVRLFDPESKDPEFPYTDTEVVFHTPDGSSQELLNQYLDAQAKTLADLQETVRILAGSLVGQVDWIIADKAPEGWVVCDGISPVYKRYPLYTRLQQIRITYPNNGIVGYNASSDSYTVNLMQENGRFIRSVTDVSQLGKVQTDEIRAIKAAWGNDEFRRANPWSKGAVILTNLGTDRHDNKDVKDLGNADVSFDANIGDVKDNPMAGHANGTDIHPANVALLPIIYCGIPMA